MQEFTTTLLVQSMAPTAGANRQHLGPAQLPAAAELDTLHRSVVSLAQEGVQWLAQGIHNEALLPKACVVQDVAACKHRYEQL